MVLISDNWFQVSRKNLNKAVFKKKKENMDLKNKQNYQMKAGSTQDWPNGNKSMGWVAVVVVYFYNQ